MIIKQKEIEDIKNEIWITAEDIRQYAYCPRKIYFRYVLRQRFLTTPKIDRGKELHTEHCKNKRPEKIGPVERYYNVYMRDNTLKISGSADILEWNESEGVIVDLKTGHTKENGIWYPDKMQLTALSILAEAQFNLTIKRVGVWDFKKDTITYEEIDNKDRLKVIEIADKARIIISEEIFPKAKHGKKCSACEYNRLCWGF